MMGRRGSQRTGAGDAGRVRSRRKTPWHHKLGTALRLRPIELAAALYALAVAISVEVLLRVLSLPRLSRLYGVRLGPAEPGRDASQSAVPPLLSRGDRLRVRGARRIMEAWPFGKGRCLRTALVVGHMLRSHDPVLRVGVEQLDDGVGAHAWLEIEGHTVLSDHGATPFHTL